GSAGRSDLLRTASAPAATARAPAPSQPRGAAPPPDDAEAASGRVVVDATEVMLDVDEVVLVDVVDVDVVDDVVLGAAVVGGAVGAGGGGGCTGAPPVARRAKVPSVIRRWAASPGQAVVLMSRCPLIVGVVTEAPAGWRFEPRDVKVVVAPGDRSRPWRSPRKRSSPAIAATAASVGGAVL